MDHPTYRRRGEQLEDAVLRATWEELALTGYSRLTMEAVAERARTSKAVLYRRWPNRALLVLAALRTHAPMLSGEAPDTGSLRGDVLTLLRRVSQRLGDIGAETVWGLLANLLSDTAALETLRRHTLDVGSEAMETILRRAQARGEIPVRVVPARVRTLAIDLARHELFLNRAAVADAVLVDIVDNVFLPLVRL